MKEEKADRGVVQDALDEIDVAKRTLGEQDQQEMQEVATGYDEQALRNLSLTQTDVHMFGDGAILMQVVQLLSYIRHAVRNNMETEITLKFGREIANAEFNFDANGFVVPDLIPKGEVQIN